MKDKKVKYYKNREGKILFSGIFFFFFFLVIATGTFIVYAKFKEESSVKVLGSKDKKNNGEIEAINVQFSSSVRKEEVKDSIFIKPALRATAEWQDKKEIKITPSEDLRPNTEYVIYFSGVKTKWFKLEKNFQLKVVTPKLPKIQEVSPSDKQKDVKYEERILIDFNKEVPGNVVVRTEIEPPVEFSELFNDDKTQLTITPEKELAKGQEYKVKIFLNHKKFDDINEEVYSGNFLTKIPPYIVYNFDKDGNPTKTEPREEDYVAEITEGRYIHLDLSSQVMVLFENGIEKGAFKVSSGKRGMATPQGTFKVLSKRKRPWSAKYGLYMPWFIGFTRQGHGIHELPEWPGGYKEGANHLGIPVSHGCVRLGIGPAKMVYDFVEIGTPMVIVW